jgi:hypothetical protein
MIEENAHYSRLQEAIDGYMMSSGYPCTSHTRTWLQSVFRYSLVDSLDRCLIRSRHSLL